MELSKEDKILLALAEDKLQQCSRQYRVTYTPFLDIRQRSLIENQYKGYKQTGGDVRLEFYGGYDEAERTVAVFLPDYADISDCPLSVIRIKTPVGGRKLGHRDYLGSLTGLGIKREMTGDILAVEYGADIIVLDEIADFILMNYTKAGRTEIKAESVDLSSLHIPEKKTVIVKDTVASLRLDNIISSAFQISRAKSTEAIRSGAVFVNSVQVEKPDFQINEGAKLVLRRKGKAYLREVGGKSRKDRINVVIERYV